MKITLGRIFEIGATLATRSGKEMQNFVEYMADAVEQCIRALRNGLTFADNFQCSIKQLSLTHNVTQVVYSNGKSVVGVIPIKYGTPTNAIDSFGWELDAANNVQLKVSFVGAPTVPISVTIIILY